jgi:sarcosine oxidase
VLDAIVLGLGVMGSAALHRLALAGKRVRGLDRFEPPHAFGSSHGGTRVTRKAYFEDARYVPLLHRSWALFREMETLAKETLLVQTGGLYFGDPSHAGIEGVLRAVTEHGLAHERLDAAAIRARFPMFAPAEGDEGIFEEEAGVLLAEKCVRAQLTLAIAAGADVRTREHAMQVEVSDHGVRVTTDQGVHEAERLVLATGAWMRGGLVPVPMSLVVERQVQLYFEPKTPSLFTPARMPVFLRFGEVDTFYGLPELELRGVKVCQHHGGDVTTADALDRDLHADDETKVRAFVKRHLPDADGPLVDARVCMYTNTKDENFMVGVHPASPRVVLMGGFSGHGFKLAPAMGELVAELVTTGRTTLDAALFDPAR